jgi:hypothetical protein
VLLLGAGGLAAWRWQTERRSSLAGRWRAYIGARGANTSRDGEVVMIEIEQDGKKLSASSSAIEVEHARDWQNHRDYWKQRFGKDLKVVFYKGAGEVLEADDDRPVPGIPKGPRRVVLAVRVEVPGSTEPIDGGSLRAAIDPDERRMRGRLWVNSERAERVVDLRREP